MSRPIRAIEGHGMKPRVKVPEQVQAGDVFEIKTLIKHIMENGERVGDDGKLVPRRIINRFTCLFNGNPVFECDVHPSVSENPFFAFKARIFEPGKFQFLWHDDDGTVFSVEREVKLRG